MNIQSSSRIAREAILCFRGVRHATTVATSTEPPAHLADTPVTSSEIIATPEATPAIVYEAPKDGTGHGQTIYVFNHLQKQHVVYSLTRALNNNAALSQLPFNGKKTVPRALRKDLWAPLATLHFPSSHIGLSIFQKLREYRRRHELEWNLEDYAHDKDGERITYKKRARQLNDQKANSIADIAAVLSKLDLGVPVRTGKGKRLGIQGQGEGVPVGVRWSDILDAQFAKEWSPNVVHGELKHHTNNRVENERKGLTPAMLEHNRLQKTKAKEAKKVALSMKQLTARSKMLQKRAFNKKKKAVKEWQDARKAHYQKRIQRLFWQQNHPEEAEKRREERKAKFANLGMLTPEKIAESIEA